VLGEVERNLRTKYPATSTDFSTLVESGWLQAIDPPESLIIECAQLVHSKDATIVAAAVHSESEWLATYDQRHLLSRRTAILARYNITTARPDEILESLGLLPNP
jgi:predicted nucleic acid-binding protein